MMSFLVKLGAHGLTAIALSIFCSAISYAQSNDENSFLFLGNENISPVLFVEDGKPKGVVRDLFKEIAKRTDSTVSMQLMNWSEAQKQVQNQQADGLLQINRNPAREEYLLFSEPLLISEFPIFRRSDRIDISGPASLQGMTVGVEAAGYPRTLVERMEGVEIRILKSWSEGFRLVVEGKIDAVVVDKWVGEYALAVDGVTEVIPAPEVVDTLVSHIAARKELPELLAEVNAALQSMQADGSFDQILNRWKDEEIIYISRTQRAYWEWLKVALLATIILGALVGILGIKLTLANRSLKREREALEQRVQERTADLSRLAENEVHLRKAAEQASDAKTQFLANMSHELRTPLNAVIGFAQLLEIGVKNQTKPAQLLEYGKHIGSSGAVLLNLINDLLDFSKIQSSRFQLSEQLFTLNDEFAGLSSAFQQKAQQNNVDLRINTEIPTFLVLGDNLRLRQVLFNLIDNAIKFSAGGAVELKAEAIKTLDNRITLTCQISDSGIGIPEDRLEEVFSAFSQSDSTITREYGGTGLGLPISRTLAREMGGDVTVESTFGVGSEFKATFNFACARETEKKAPDGHSAYVRGVDALSVLAVDDVPSNLEVMENLLQGFGCNVHTVSNGPEAVKWAAQNTADVILMDLHMPEMDGISAATKIQAGAKPSSSSPIYAWTADVMAGNRLKDSSVQWAGTLLKPTTVEDLSALLRTVSKRSVT